MWGATAVYSTCQKLVKGINMETTIPINDDVMFSVSSQSLHPKLI